MAYLNQLLLLSCSTAAEVKSAIPARLFIPDTPSSLYYLARDILVTTLLVFSVRAVDDRLLAYRETAPKEFQTCVSIVRVLVWGL